MWLSIILRKLQSERSYKLQIRVNVRSIRRHVQAHRLQLLIMEVEDVGHVGGQRSQATGVVRRWKTRQDRCTDLGGDAFEDNGINPMLHRHELVQ